MKVETEKLESQATQRNHQFLPDCIRSKVHMTVKRETSQLPIGWLKDPCRWNMCAKTKKPHML